jgi:hypothetical protein
VLLRGIRRRRQAVRAMQDLRVAQARLDSIARQESDAFAFAPPSPLVEERVAAGYRATVP